MNPLLIVLLALVLVLVAAGVIVAIVGFEIEADDGSGDHHVFVSGGDLDSLTKGELDEMARSRVIDGRPTMTKDELSTAAG